MLILVEIGPGELFDRLTILEIKLARIIDAAKLDNIRLEHATLIAARDAAISDLSSVQAWVDALQETNERIWDLEDLARAREKENRFDAAYLSETREIHLFNDRRAALKREINVALGSKLVEEKSYS